MSRRTEPWTRSRPRTSRWFLRAFAVAGAVFLSSGCPEASASSDEEGEEVNERVEEREVRLPRAPDYQKVRPASPSRWGSFRSRRPEDACDLKGVGGRPRYYCPGGNTDDVDTVFLGPSRRP